MRWRCRWASRHGNARRAAARPPPRQRPSPCRRTTRSPPNSPPRRASTPSGAAASSYRPPMRCRMPRSCPGDASRRHARDGLGAAPRSSPTSTPAAARLGHLPGARYAAPGVAAVVMEDKTFPKDSSLRVDGRQELVPVEFQGKINRPLQRRPAGHRAPGADRRAGAGGSAAPRCRLCRGRRRCSLIHSSRRRPMRSSPSARPGPARCRWCWCRPPTRSFPSAMSPLNKVGLIICGNHAIRAAVAARDTFGRILAGAASPTSISHRLGAGDLRPARRRICARLPALTGHSRSHPVESRMVAFRSSAAGTAPR